MKLAGVAALGLALVWAGSASAQQQAQIYATYGPEDRGPGGPIGLVGGGPTTIHLWAWGGPLVSSSPPCEVAATGNEICGLTFSIDANGGFEIVDFIANPNFDSGSQPVAFRNTPLPGNRLTAQGFDLGVPTISNRYLGAIVVTGTGDLLGATLAVSGQVIRANLELGNVSPDVILLPEPGLIASLAVAALSLFWVARSRS